MARGNYNQDLTPTSLLIEVGTHLNLREQAEEEAALCRCSFVFLRRTGR